MAKKISSNINYLLNNKIVLNQWDDLYTYDFHIKHILEINKLLHTAVIPVIEADFLYKNTDESVIVIRVDVCIRSQGFLYVRETVIDKTTDNIIKQKHGYHLSVRSVVEYLKSRYESKNIKYYGIEYLILPYAKVYLYMEVEGSLYFRRVLSRMLVYKSNVLSPFL